MRSDPVFQLTDLAVVGRGRARLTVASLAIPAGVCAVIGPSGAGKTSLLDVLVGFEKDYVGRCEFAPPTGDGVPLFWSPAHGGFWPHLTVREHLLAVCPGDPAGGDPGRDVDRWLASLGLTDVAAALPGALSQGQHSRLGVARALASQARVLILDEPFVHVDPARLSCDWQVLMDEVRSRVCCLVFSTHDPQRVLAHADSVLALADGAVLYDGPVDPLYHHPATEQLASVLGPFTWVPEAERGRWTDASLPSCTRPEQLRLCATSDGPIVVRATDRRGPISQSLLDHETAQLQRSFCHVTTPGLTPGARVVLQVCSLLLFLLIGACSAEAPETLGMRAVRHRQLPPIGTRLLAPRALTMLDADRLMVLDNGGRILILGRDGEVHARWMMPDFEVGRPEGACLLRDGRIAVADTHYSRVVFFDGKGTVLSMLGSRGTEPGQFIYPIKVIQDPQGNLYVAEYGSNDRIQKFTEGGELLLSFGSFGTAPGQFQRPSGLVWSGGLIYVADAINHRVQVFTDQGKYRGILGQDIPGEGKTPGEAPLGLKDPRLTFKLPYDLAMGPSGDLYVCEYGAGRVTRFTRQGRLVGRFGEPGLAQGHMRTPWGLTVARDGRVFVADTGNKRIVEWRK